MRLSSLKFFLPPHGFLQAGERGRRLERQALAGQKAGWETGLGSEERAASCGVKASAKVTRPSSAGCSGPEGRREGLTGPVSPENKGEPPGACSGKWIHPVQTLRSVGGAELRHAGGPGPGRE